MGSSFRGERSFADRRFFLSVVSLVLGAVVVALISFLVGNTIDLSDVLHEEALRYAKDVIGRTERDVVARIESYEDQAQNLAEGFIFVSESDLAGRLATIEQLSQAFDGLALVGPDGMLASSGAVTDGVDGWLQGVDDLFTSMNVGTATGADLVVTAPVSTLAGPAALVCMQSETGLREALDSSGLDELCFSTIVYESGEVAMLPASPLPDKAMSLLTSDERGAYLAEASRIVDGSSAEGPYIDLVTNANGEKSYMACVDLEPEEWHLVTFVPEAMYTARVGSYIQAYWSPVLICCAALLFLFASNWVARRRNIVDMEQALFVDPLTGGLTDAAFNRRFLELVRPEVSRSYYVLCMNIVGFGNVSERYGEDVACQLLKRIYEVLEGLIAPDEAVARSERDHFYLLLRAPGTAELAERSGSLVAALQKAAEEIAPMGTFEVSQGCCSVEAGNESIRLMQDRAARASSLSQEVGRVVFYRADLEEVVGRRIALEQSFAECLGSGAFKVHLQPKVGIARSAGLLSAEALVRLDHPVLGSVSPSEFIPVFERNRTVPALDFYVFERVCAQMSSWASHPDLSRIGVSVNLSRVTLIERGPGVVDDLVAIRDRYGIPAGMIDIEITESVSLDADLFSMVREAIAGLHGHGFTVSCDDFGYGYSSLATLKDFEVDTLKLDRRFLVGSADRGWKIIDAFIALAHALDMLVVAEGVECEEDARHLEDLDCDFIQGYYYARPMPVDRFEGWARDHLAGPAPTAGAAALD